MKKKIFAQTWHGAIFYFVGREFEKLFKDYTMYMIRNKLFNTPLPRYKQAFEPYLSGEYSLGESIRKLVEISPPW